MNNIILTWLVFIGTAAAIFFSGKRLSTVADKIGKVTGLGGAFVGVLLLPIVTTLPELSVTISAIIIDAPNLALGNLFGSNLLNLSLIFFMDIAQGKGPIAKKLSFDHILAVSMLTIILTIALTGIVEQELFTIGHLGGSSLLIFFVYFVSHTIHYRYHKRNPNLSTDPVDSSEPPDERNDSKNNTRSSESLKKLVFEFAVLGIIIIVSARFLSGAADTIAENTGLTEGLLGVVFLALSTSLPELVITLSAVKKGFFDQAFGSILGANILNMGLIFIVDTIYLKGPILQFSEQEIFNAAVIGILMTNVIAAGIIYRSKRSYFYLGIDAIVILILYIIFLISSIA
ncbi:sodium:calcium antiporter [Natranaerobius thermophilus]|uniref:Sodium/calcium exchanger membrane region n=1 Tax=Natranaerobius thermophilus (strain ATCC BAA-1301 / DSM 18059 / JW/NM-WN-LF) TaxID=457570 RepID=B2A4V0_NATTJ|nr:sodium:calcium antiporter [Natranaerobius thermophilus]ACB83872.1 sodium/calcium exchanger membrane region [Natranaerobius thermophilus JW/NM-WN-LF]